MREVTLGKSGLRVSAVGFGGIPIQRVSEKDAIRTIRRALELGVNFIDTAAGYTDSQTKIGKAIHGRHEGLILASKSGQRTKAGMAKDIDRARRELGAETIDLFQLHGISLGSEWETASGPGGALEALREARDEGHVGHIGFTAHSLETALALVDNPLFETVQFPFNMITAEPADELIPKARANGLGFIVMKPLCGGQFHDANLAFKFLNGYPDLVPIPGIERPDQIEQIVEIVASGQTLAGAEKAEAERIAAKLGKLFCRRCGYCEPCEHGVPVMLCMIFEGLARRLPRASVQAGAAKTIAAKAGECVECGDCEQRCPYDLPIRDTVKEALASARAILDSQAG